MPGSLRAMGILGLGAQVAADMGIEGDSQWQGCGSNDGSSLGWGSLPTLPSRWGLGKVFPGRAACKVLLGLDDEPRSCDHRQPGMERPA